MEDSRSLIFEWLHAGADYDQGAVLFARVGKKRNLAAIFPGKKHRYELKLCYELCKSVGLDWKNLPGVDSGSSVPLEHSVNVESREEALDGFDDNKQYPVINRVRTMSPKPFQMLSTSFNYRCLSIHAKVALLWNDNLKISVVTSQNATDNPKMERGIIQTDPAVFAFDLKILEDAFERGTT